MSTPFISIAKNSKNLEEKSEITGFFIDTPPMSGIE